MAQITVFLLVIFVNGIFTLTCEGPDYPNSHLAEGDVCADSNCPDVKERPCPKLSVPFCKCNPGFCRPVHFGPCNETVPICGNEENPNSHLAFEKKCGDSLCPGIPSPRCLAEPQYICQCDEGFCRPYPKPGYPCTQKISEITWG